jgi:hypothetical protein
MPTPWHRSIFSPAKQGGQIIQRPTATDVLLLGPYIGYNSVRGPNPPHRAGL